MRLSTRDRLRVGYAARFDDEADVEATVAEHGRASVAAAYRGLRADELLSAWAGSSIVHVVVDSRSVARIEIPPCVRAAPAGDGPDDAAAAGGAAPTREAATF